MNPVGYSFAIWLLFVNIASGKIKNGYESEFDENKMELQRLHSRLTDGVNRSFEERRALKAAINSLEDYFAYRELTDTLISQLKTVCPSMHWDIDHLLDLNGQETDVFIRLISRERTINSLRGASFFTQSASDENTNVSSYGSYSVSVDIWISDNSLLLLCHELGHVQYIVPNLAAYTRFYKQRYSADAINVSYLGHCPNDLSGRLAEKFVRQFISDRRAYLRSSGRRPGRITIALSEIRERITYRARAIYPSPAIASNQ